MKTPNKIDAFELFLLGLVEWYLSFKNLDSFDSFNKSNDLSKLKLLKLHFFTCAADNSGKLFETFDKFYAMPYGHVESDVYTFIDNLKYFKVTNECLEIKLEFSSEIEVLKNQHDSFFEIIQNALLELRDKNPGIISYSSFQLVNLSHNWYSWIAMFDLARESGRYSESIPIEVIKSEKKIFELI